MLPTRKVIVARRSGLNSTVCLTCQWRTFTTSPSHPAEAPLPPRPTAFENAPRAYGRRVDEFVPKPLDRPIGLSKPPNAGENTGLGDQRTWQQRRDDFVNHEKHMVRRREMTEQMSRPYYREWTNMRHHKGKSFIAPTKLFKADRALYFPNLHGQTYSKDDLNEDTTAVLAGKTSIVCIYSTKWAENQANTFVSEEKHPELRKLVEENRGILQIVRVNHVDDIMQAWLVKLFMPSVRRRMSMEEQARQFLIRKGFTEDIREAIGVLNSKVGYTFLVDKECRIRWAGSAHAQPEEKESLLRGVRRLLEEHQARKEGKVEERRIEESPSRAQPAEAVA